MRTIYTKRQLQTGDKIVIPAPTINKGDEVKIVNPTNLDPFVIGVCTGGIPPLQTPSKNGKTANVYRDYREFVVKS
jgi:hypothetical protein